MTHTYVEHALREKGRMKHFVCDRCANYWQAYRAKTCPACKHDALWMFDYEHPARDLVAQIRSGTRRDPFKDTP